MVAPDVAELSRISVFGCCGAGVATAVGGAVLSALSAAFGVGEAFDDGSGAGVVGEPGELVPRVELALSAPDARVLDAAGVDGDPGAELEEPGEVELEPCCVVSRPGADGVGDGVVVGGFAGASAGTLLLGTAAGVVVVCGIPEADLGSADGGVWAEAALQVLMATAKVRKSRERCIGS